MTRYAIIRNNGQTITGEEPTRPDAAEKVARMHADPFYSPREEGAEGAWGAIYLSTCGRLELLTIDQIHRIAQEQPAGTTQE